MDWDSLASQAASALVSGAMGIAGNAIEYKYSKKLAELQNQYNLDMWNRTNEYNSPQAQMQRFQEAGLNPNLIYGQGTSGNTSAPQMVTADTPKISENMRRIGEAFNIENLRTVIAKRKEAEANAQSARIDAKRNEDTYDGELALASNYSYDPTTGTYVDITPLIGSRKVAGGIGKLVENRALENNYLRGHLIPFRQALLESQKNYLAPQIEMANYEAKYYPYSFWIGQGSKALQGLGSVIPKLKIPVSRSYTSSTGRVFSY